MSFFSRGGHRYARGEDHAIAEASTTPLSRLAPDGLPLSAIARPPHQGHPALPGPATQPTRRPRPLAVTAAQPTFTPFPAAGRPRGRRSADAALLPGFPVPLSEPPVIGDSMQVREPATATGASLVPYTGPGWARMLAAIRLVNRGRDARAARRAEELHAQVDRGLGRNAAEFHTSLRHSRETIAAGTLPCMAANHGHPEMAGELLRRVAYFNAHPDERDGRAG